MTADSDAPSSSVCRSARSPGASGTQFAIACTHGGITRRGHRPIHAAEEPGADNDNARDLSRGAKRKHEGRRNERERNVRERNEHENEDTAQRRAQRKVQPQHHREREERGAPSPHVHTKL